MLTAVSRPSRLLRVSRVKNQTVPMPPKKADSGDKPKKRVKSGGGGGKKISAYNKYVQQELARLKEDDPNMSHTERFKLAAQNWKTAKENPKAAA